MIFLDGKMLKIDELLELLTVKDNDDRKSMVSANSHPYFFVSFYNYHPCQTQQIIENFVTDNLVKRYLFPFPTIINCSHKFINFFTEMISQINFYRFITCFCQFSFEKYRMHLLFSLKKFFSWLSFVGTQLIFTGSNDIFFLNFKK